MSGERIILDILDEVADYFDNRTDADQPSGSPYPIPNEEMRLLMEVEKAAMITQALHDALNGLAMFALGRLPAEDLKGPEMQAAADAMKKARGEQ